MWNLEACLALSRPGQVATLTPPGFPSSTNPSAGAPVAPSGMPLATTTTATAGTASGTPRSSSALGSSSGGGLGSSSGGGGGSFHPMQRVVSKALRRHHKPVLAMAATADSKYLVTGGADRTVRVWDTGSGYCLATLRGHHGDGEGGAVCGGCRDVWKSGTGCTEDCRRSRYHICGRGGGDYMYQSKLDQTKLTSVAQAEALVASDVTCGMGERRGERRRR